jgi:hypothetical protein
MSSDTTRKVSTVFGLHLANCRISTLCLPTATSWAASTVVDYLSLDNPLIFESTALSSPLSAFPFLSVSFSAFKSFSLALDIANTVLALAADGLSELNKLKNIFL